MNQTDLFSLQNPNSAIRKIIETSGKINLRDFPSEISIPINYNTKDLFIEFGESKEISSLITPELSLFKKNGYPSNIYTPIYEAILNAYQHGNKNDPKKKIIFSYRLEDEHLDILVEDEGGIIESNFAAFILRHREIDVKKQFLDYYSFSRKNKPRTNNGTGTSFMHAYMDEVNYYLGEHGLMVHMVKNKSNESVQ